MTLRLGTRGSKLALTQSQHVADAITAATGVAVELVIISTRGDRIQDRPLQAVGGKGLFTLELEEGLRAGDLDLAVHSMKDMPTDDAPGLVIASIPKREDPRDVLVGATLATLKQGAVVGTGSLRRRQQLLVMRPDLDIQGIRGNVDTRIAKQRAGTYDAIVLAAAGLNRLGLQDVIDEAIGITEMIPAVGQGALAVQARRDDRKTLELLESIHDPTTATCVAAERSFLKTIEGGCSVPAAAHCIFEGDQIRIQGVFAPEDGEARSATLRSDPLHAIAVGRELAQRLRA